MRASSSRATPTAPTRSGQRPTRDARVAAPLRRARRRLPPAREFVFTTAHLYQHLVPHGGATVARSSSAQEFDREYAAGKGAAVVVIEHLGARHYEAMARSGGGPGRELVLTTASSRTRLRTRRRPTRRSLQSVVGRDLRATIALAAPIFRERTCRFTRASVARGNPYLLHLLPTVAFIAAPWTLSRPATRSRTSSTRISSTARLSSSPIFSMRSARSSRSSRGSGNVERATREVLCASGQDVSSYVRCAGSPSDPASPP